jgi:nucleotide-binding universal stress UspA family protein
VIGPGPLPARILIPLANPRTASDLVRIGAALLDPEHDGELIALGIVEVPEGVPLSEGATQARHARRLLQRVHDFVPEKTVLRTMVRIGRRASEGILEAARDEGADLIIFGWGGRPHGGRGGATGGHALSDTIDAVARQAPCAIAVVKQRGLDTVKRILVPVRGGPNAELALRYADALGRALDGEVVALHVLPPGAGLGIRTQAERALNAFVRSQTDGDHVRSRLREAANVRSAILREAESADLVVLGAGAEPAGGSGGDGARLFGELPETIAARAHPTVMVVHTQAPLRRETFEELAARSESLAAADRAAEEARAVPALVERWFAESSFHASEFADLDRLVARKERLGTSISLVLPALNEEDTIGNIVARAVRELMRRHRLVDEILVIDSGSTDRTREIAAAEGARVIVHGDILPRYGAFIGKGEALWKSLYEARGDIIAWVDTDVRSWHPRFVYGPVGALLEHPRLQYVKGYYQRPIVEGGVLREGGGGRVTELVARPLINLFYPQLSGVIQPLSGEYAGRRSILETLPFFTGYAVEIGHLIDIVEHGGLEALGQVDLERRVHRNQELEGLSKMSFTILQAVMKRVEEGHRTRLFAELGSTMKLPRTLRGRLYLDVIELADQERPPMMRLPEDVERFHPVGG